MSSCISVYGGGRRQRGRASIKQGKKRFTSTRKHASTLIYRFTSTITIITFTLTFTSKMEYVFYALLATPHPTFILNHITRYVNSGGVRRGVGRGVGHGVGAASVAGAMRNVSILTSSHSTANTTASISSASASASSNTVRSIIHNHGAYNNNNNYPTDVGSESDMNNYHKITGMNDSKASRTIILLRDLLFFWAIMLCRSFLHLVLSLLLATQ